MRTVEAGLIGDAVRRLFIGANIDLPDGVRRALERARELETWAPAIGVLKTLEENSNTAQRLGIPICQDTGMACVFLDIGSEVFVDGDIAAAVDDGVARACREGYLRASVVSDPLRRENTGDNTPAALYIDAVPGDKITVTVAPKGFGSENMSGLKMLKPADGRQGVVDFVLETVEAAGGSPCPPVVLGVGIGGNFDKAALLAKRALLRPLGEAHPDPYYAELESELLDKINELGIGPMGYGGRTTALGVAVLAAPTHIAGLPAAVNINCHVARHATEEI